MGYENAKKGFERCMKKLGLEYLDLLLIHHPYGDVYGAWKAMSEFYNEGRIKALGVSNFYEGKFTEFCEISEIKPMVNQIETHPFYTHYSALENMKQYGCIPQAWAPLAEGKHGIFTHPVLSEIGEKYGKTAAQTALRWNVQRGVSIIPKSVHKERIEQNFNISDFTLTDDEMKRIDALDTGRSEIIDINDPGAVKFLLSIKVD